MKRFWIACFAITAATLMVSNAYAQFQSPEIGSYQSILSRTGYGSSPVGGAVGTIPGALPGQLADAVPQVVCLLYTSPSPRDQRGSRMPSSA